MASRGETTAEASYYIPFLNIGDYELVVEAAGFKKFIRGGITLQAGSTTRIDLQMEVGGLPKRLW